MDKVEHVSDFFCTPGIFFPHDKVKKVWIGKDYSGAHMNTTGVPVMQPVQPQQMMPNGSAAAMQQPLQYVLPSIDAPTNHLAQSTFRSITPRNLSNPTMQFGPGEVNIDQPVPGNYTIQSRYSQAQTSTSYPTVSQVSAFPGPYNPSAYNPSGYSQSVFSMSNPQYYPVVTPPFCPAPGVYYQTPQPPAFMQHRMVYQQQIPMSAASVTAAHQRQKKVLKIVNPITNEVTNTDEVTQNTRSEQHEGGRRSAASLDTPSRDVTQHSNASQTLQRQVAESVFNAPRSSSASPPGVIDESISDQSSPQSLLPPAQPVETQSVKQAEASTFANAEAVSSRKLGASEVSAAAEKDSEEETKFVEISSPADTISASAADNTDSGVDMAGTAKDATADAKESDKPAKDIEPAKSNQEIQSEFIPKFEPETPTPPVETSEVEAAADYPDKTLPVQPVDVVEKTAEIKAPLQIDEITEVIEEKESEEAVKERKRKEFEAKRQELLNEKELIVDMANKRYGRRYMYLMREIIKEFALAKSCPVDIGELKNLGIDIASAPAAAPSGFGSGRRCDFSMKSGSFTPTWVENKTQKPKPYYGRASDRSGHGARGDRERKKALFLLSSIARFPNIDRPPREPVKLHKAEHAWRPDIGKKDVEDEKKKLYKQIRGLLNKITPSTFDALAQEFLRYKCYQDKENMNEIINIIFDKAVEEPKFCPLYSDLCKKQVMDELQESKISEFRSGILTRCQRTFENKCQSEIDKKKKEAEEEQDEKRKMELKVEVMELEAKERRRMFGNIGFIGQLYRHELIVPKILRWCIIHLLKNHSESPGGDEESIECAVRMLETVGKIVDQHSQTSDFLQQNNDFDLNGYFRHLRDLSNSVSNRIRFLIMNLIELRESGWNPRKSADSGPMTIAAVHDEARKEEMQAKLARDQYDKARKPYDGRASLDRRRAPLVGRQSQDNRFYKGDQSRDQKTRAAGQAAHTAGTSSRKNQTLSTVDQPGKLGYRKGAFNLGSSGGSGQDGRRSGLSSFRGAGRGMVASRESSEPSSREPSESRKHSVAGDRLERDKALIAAQALPRSHMPTSASASCLTTNLEGTCSRTHSDEDDHSHANVLSPEDEKKMFLSFSARLHTYFDSPKDEKQVKELFDALKEVISKSSVTIAFRLLMRVGVEKIGGKKEEGMHRQYLGRALCLCLQEVKNKEDALQGIAEFCTYAVENELWDEAPYLWEWVAEIISWSIMCDTKDVEGERPSLSDFEGAFITADKDKKKKHALLVCTLYRLAEIEQGREGNTSSTAMAFEELKSLDCPSLREALREKTFPSGASLHDTLLN